MIEKGFGKVVIGISGIMQLQKKYCKQMNIIQEMRNLQSGTGLRVDTEGIVTIGYGYNTVQTTVGDVTLTNF